ncbi:MAG TPA: RDD family protein [Bacteroidia bacterium]|nr:RDD family protein [Bacteroidia bacterium]
METEHIEHVYAGFWARLAAYFLDNAILAFLLINSMWLAREQLSGYFAVHPEVLKALQGEVSTTDYSGSYDYISKFMYYYIIIFGFIFSWIYFAGFESSHLGGTPGKWILGIYVTDYDGKRISFGRASGRHFGKIISGLILGIGYMMAGFTEKFQALHDNMAETLVWKK